MGVAINGGGKATSRTTSFAWRSLDLTERHLGVIEIPGTSKSTTPGLTPEADIEVARNMVLGYMENPRSVMLAVIPANVDVATQESIELASDVNPDGDRILGVLTEPDLVDKGAEAK